MSEGNLVFLESNLDHALFQGQIQGIITTCYENERPLGGLSGLLDWRFHGAISQCVRAGLITGQAGECVYFPITRNASTYHLILVGAGHSSAPGHRIELPVESLKVLKKNLASLGLAKVGISRADFGNVSDDYFVKQMKGIPLCIIQ